MATKKAKRAGSRPTPKPAPRKAAKRKAPVRKAASRKAVRPSATAVALFPVFLRLRMILAPYGKFMHIKHDVPGLYYLETIPVPKYGEEVFFGAVQIGEGHVSFHLLPIDVFPELLADISPKLRARMQGSTCFNFRAIEPGLFDELKTLTRAGFDGYKRGGVIG